MFCPHFDDKALWSDLFVFSSVVFDPIQSSAYQIHQQQSKSLLTFFGNEIIIYSFVSVVVVSFRIRSILSLQLAHDEYLICSASIDFFFVSKIIWKKKCEKKISNKKMVQWKKFQLKIKSVGEVKSQWVDKCVLSIYL